MMIDQLQVDLEHLILYQPPLYIKFGLEILILDQQEDRILDQHQELDQQELILQDQQEQMIDQPTLLLI